MSDRKFSEHCEQAAETVSQWPEWKRNALRWNMSKRQMKTYRFTTHWDENSREWVLRFGTTDGSNFAGIGCLNGEMEADIIRDVLNGAVELWEARNDRALDEHPDLRKARKRGVADAVKIVDPQILFQLIGGAT